MGRMQTKRLRLRNLFKLIRMTEKLEAEIPKRLSYMLCIILIRELSYYVSSLR